MNKSTSLADTETVIEFFSSKAIFAAKRKKAFRRRLVVVVLTGLKILTVVYFGFGDLFESNRATAADPAILLKAAAPSVP